MRAGVIERFRRYVYERTFRLVVTQRMLNRDRVRYPSGTGVEKNFRRAIIRHLLDFEVIVHIQSHASFLGSFGWQLHGVIDNLASSQDDDLDVIHLLAV